MASTTTADYPLMSRYLAGEVEGKLGENHHYVRWADYRCVKARGWSPGDACITMSTTTKGVVVGVV